MATIKRGSAPIHSRRGDGKGAGDDDRAGYYCVWWNRFLGRIVVERISVPSSYEATKQITPWHLAGSTRIMPAGQIGELRTYLYVCQTAADVDCDQRGDVGDREAVGRDKLLSI
jgi:hypothetical protein